MTKPSTSADEAGATWLRLASGSTSAAVDARRAALPLAAAREGRLMMMLMLHAPRRMASSRHFQRAAERAACGDSSRRSGSMSMSRCQSDTAGGTWSGAGAQDAVRRRVVDGVRRRVGSLQVRHEKNHIGRLRLMLRREKSTPFYKALNPGGSRTGPNSRGNQKRAPLPLVRGVSCVEEHKPTSAGALLAQRSWRG